MAEQKLLPYGLRQINRFITDHDREGKAVFSSQIDESLPWDDVGAMAKFALGYTTSRFPVSFNDQKDIKDYQGHLKIKPGITVPGGTVLRIVDIPPLSISPMHRTVSLDYGVVLDGEVLLKLDSGETRVLGHGDVAIQRGTNHSWQNISETKWARMLYVLQASEVVNIADKPLSEDYGSGMPGVKASH